jgi:long-chain acyl-CoA synthetase
VFRGYWNNRAATQEVIDGEGWFHTGDIGRIDDDGFLFITGRKKELLVTANGKNVAPAPLEDRIRSHALVSQCLVVGDGRPFVAALITLDPDALGPWAKAHGLPEDSTPADLCENADLLTDLQHAVDAANRKVSQAESIRKFKVLSTDWTEAGGQMTPSLKVKRNVIMAECASEIAAIYGK